jgi:glyoxylase-like metal-dependent hydrolase (beta-lactamase superfamily II)
MNFKITPLNTGFIPTKPLEYHYHFSCKPYLKDVKDEPVPLPDFTFLLEGEDGTLVMVDTGMAWTERANKYHHKGSWQREGIDDIESMLKKVGHTPAEIDLVVFTHLHWDHVFYLEKFTKARLIVNKKEWEYAHNPVPLHFKSYERPIIAKDGDVVIAPFDQEGVKERFEFVEGETEILPGLSVYESFGHCPGHQTIVAQTKNGPYYCVGDSVFVMGNIDTTPEVEANLHYDILPPGRYVDIVASWNTIRDTLRRCKEAGVDPHKHLLLAHDYLLADYVEAYEKENGRLPVFGE